METKKGSAGGQARAIQLREESIKKYNNNPKICKFCDKAIPLREGIKVAQIRLKNFCNNSCAASHNNKGRAKPKQDTEKTEKKKSSRSIDNITKSQLFLRCNGYQSARSSICRAARRIYRKSSKSKKCLICGYDLYYDVCHIKSVSDFDDTSLISEINNIDNLIALCPNHHIEYDLGLLNVYSFNKK